MATYSVKSRKREPQTLRKNKVMNVEPAGAAFFSFRYSSTEISVVGGRARIKSRQARFEDGTFKSEAFEGELDRTAYDEMMRRARRYFLGILAVVE